MWWTAHFLLPACSGIPSGTRQWNKPLNLVTLTPAAEGLHVLQEGGEATDHLLLVEPLGDGAERLEIDARLLLPRPFQGLSRSSVDVQFALESEKNVPFCG